MPLLRSLLSHVHRGSLQTASPHRMLPEFHRMSLHPILSLLCLPSLSVDATYALDDGYAAAQNCRTIAPF